MVFPLSEYDGSLSASSILVPEWCQVAVYGSDLARKILRILLLQHGEVDRWEN